MASETYEVRWMIKVDRPERRCPTFPVVPAGTAIHQVITFTSQRAAVIFFDGILAGELDFGSEYVQFASVYAYRVGHFRRTVRREVRRTRRPVKVHTFTRAEAA